MTAEQRDLVGSWLSLGLRQWASGQSQFGGGGGASSFGVDWGGGGGLETGSNGGPSTELQWATGYAMGTERPRGNNSTQSTRAFDQYTKNAGGQDKNNDDRREIDTADTQRQQRKNGKTSADVWHATSYTSKTWTNT